MKKRLCFLILVCSIIFFSGLSFNTNAADRHYIRVGLFYGNVSEDRYEVSFDNGVRLAKLDKNDVINGAEYENARTLVANFRNGYADFSLQDKNGDEIRRFDLSEANMVVPFDFEGDGSFKVKGRSYRGAVLFNDLKGTLNLINYIDEEKYLYGVVGNEIGKSVPAEAQKAQAVASRSYCRVKMGTHENYGFDICSTPHCQYYRGKDSENTAIIRAVDDTFEKTIRYNGKTVAAFYSKNTGGYRSASEDIWNEKLGYLRTKEDIYSPDFTWKKTLTKREIESKLINAGKNVGNLRAMRVEERAASGAVKKLAFIGDDSTVTLEKDRIRTTLGASDVKSLMFTFNGNFQKMNASNQINSQTQSTTAHRYVVAIGRGGNCNIDISDYTSCIASESGYLQAQNIKIEGLKAITASGLFTLQGPEKIEEKNAEVGDATKKLFDKVGGSDYVSMDQDALFTGLGYGHGVGMSQDGVIQMANRGFGYEDILKYYYDDITVD